VDDTATDTATDRPTSLAGFLREQRARVRPEQVALRPYGRRRVPGLRREELSQLAGISFSYYARMEQGKALRVSDGILDAIARVLRMDESAHARLRALGGTPPGTEAGPPAD
jgi:transcriptional regulator with XRE-family HTH domain